MPVMSTPMAESMQESAAANTPSKASGLLSSFVRNIGVNVMGTQSLALEDIQSALEQLKKKLMERNVAEEIAAKSVPLGRLHA